MIHGLIVETISELPQPPDFILLAPHLAGLTADLGDLVGILPIGSINQTLLDRLAALPPSPFMPPYCRPTRFLAAMRCSRNSPRAVSPPW